MRTLSDGTLRTLTEVDHVDQEALVASPARDSSTIIGVARFVRYVHDHVVADLAITVADEWHGRGVATGLLRLLSRRAAEVGITRFTADMLSDNRAVLALVQAAGGVETTGAGGTIVTARVHVEDVLPHHG
jgi:RimJ/RimL family protein N-acetyltransferase